MTKYSITGVIDILTLSSITPVILVYQLVMALPTTQYPVHDRTMKIDSSTLGTNGPD